MPLNNYFSLSGATQITIVTSYFRRKVTGTATLVTIFQRATFKIIKHNIVTNLIKNSCRLSQNCNTVRRYANPNDGEQFFCNNKIITFVSVDFISLKWLHATRSRMLQRYNTSVGRLPAMSRLHFIVDFTQRHLNGSFDGKVKYISKNLQRL